MVLQNGEEGALFRPYAPTANIVAVLQRLRRMNLPSRVGRDFLRGAQISEALIPRVVSTLRFLGLTNGSDEPQDVLRALAAGSEEEYHQVLERVIRTAYAADFQNINPTTDPQGTIENAFQRYTPRSQHSRQVMLFLGLCREAGIPTADAPRERGMQQPRPREAQPRGERRRRVVPPAKIPGLRPQQEAVEQFLSITLEDAALMPQEEFTAAWAALGTVFRRRAERLYRTSQADEQLPEQAAE